MDHFGRSLHHVSDDVRLRVDRPGDDNRRGVGPLHRRRFRLQQFYHALRRDHFQLCNSQIFGFYLNLKKSQHGA